MTEDKKLLDMTQQELNDLLRTFNTIADHDVQMAALVAGIVCFIIGFIIGLLL